LDEPFVFYGIAAAEETRECPACGHDVPAHLFGSSQNEGEDCPHCGDPLPKRGQRTAKIEKEDVMGPRVVRQLEDIVVVLDNPRFGRTSGYSQDKLPEVEGANFVISKSRGFQVYADTRVSDNPYDLEGEPVFKGTLITERLRPPSYHLKVTL
jgi:endogenous inhibitor of DNA gyrase (YacG/DUF329 family)